MTDQVQSSGESIRQAACGFRFGAVAQIYYDLTGTALPKQLDLLDIWFPDLVVSADPSDGETKIEAFYADQEYRIHAVRYHGKLYSGGNGRVRQICGRLSGTASGNREKERKSAELIQKHVAECFISDMELTPRLKKNTEELLKRLTSEQQESLRQELTDLLYELAAQRESMCDYDRKTEPFPMDDETFDGVIYNCGYQLSLGTFSGLVCAWLWLLTGCLLRGETGRVLRLYDSSFIAVRRQISENGKLADKLDYLFHPELYGDTFRGDGKDLESRFPGVEWFCDRCEAHLNEQPGFDDHLPEWTCTTCGCVNRLELSEVYDNEEDWQNHVRPADPEKFEEAVRQRREELEDREEQENR